MEGMRHATEDIESDVIDFDCSLKRLKSYIVRLSEHTHGGIFLSFK